MNISIDNDLYLYGIDNLIYNIAFIVGFILIYMEYSVAKCIYVDSLNR
jgi:hypothetical protein